jgi:hypothetical protein
MLIGKVDLAAERVAAEEVRKRGLYVDDVPGQHFKLASVVPDMNTSLVCPPIDEKLPHLGSLAMLSAQPSTYESVEDEDEPSPEKTDEELEFDRKALLKLDPLKKDE